MTAITERGRRELYERAEASWGKDAADLLMTLLPPVGWAEVATKADLEALEKRLLGEIAILRGEMDGQIGSLRGEFKSENAKLFRSLLWMNVMTVVSVCGMAFAITRAA